MIAATVLPPVNGALSLLDLIIAATPDQLSKRGSVRASSVHIQWVSGTVTVHYSRSAAAPTIGYILDATNRTMILRDKSGDRVSLAEVFLSGTAGSSARIAAYPLTGSGAAFADPVAWFKGDGIVGLADTNPVASWNDVSGNGNHAVQAVGADQPLYRTNIVNGLPVVRFDGVSDFLQSPYSASNNPDTVHQSIFTVFRTASVAAIQIMVWQGEAAGNGFGLEFEAHTQIGNGLLQANAVGAYVGGQNTQPGSNLFPFTDTTNFHILTALFKDLRSDPIVSISVDGGPFATTFSTLGDEIQNWIGATRLGRPGVATRFYNGDIAEVMMFDSDMTGDTDGVISYLKAKYNIP